MTEAKTREQYNRLASIYDRRWRSYVTHSLNFLKDWTQIPPDAVVLDVACGTGEFERLLVEENLVQQIVGVDISENMLAIARHKLHPHPHVSFCSAPASALPFSDQSFDVVVSANAFHYFDNPETALAEMKRVLKSDGTVVILDWCKDYLLCRLCDIVLKLLDPAYQQCYTQTEFHQLLTSAGFKLQAATRVRFGIVWGLMIASVTPWACACTKLTKAP